MNFKRAINYNIQIEPTQNNGFIVRVGCACFAYQNATDLISELEAYLNNAEAWEKKYHGSSNLVPEDTPEQVVYHNRTQGDTVRIQR